VQVDPIEPVLKAPKTKRLKLNVDELLSSFAFKFSLRRYIKEGDKGLLLITHYQRLLDIIHPDFVHVMEKGKIIQTGDKSIAEQLESGGFANLQPSK